MSPDRDNPADTDYGYWWIYDTTGAKNSVDTMELLGFIDATAPPDDEWGDDIYEAIWEHGIVSDEFHPDQIDYIDYATFEKAIYVLYKNNKSLLIQWNERTPK